MSELIREREQVFIDEGLWLSRFPLMRCDRDQIDVPLLVRENEHLLIEVDFLIVFVEAIEQSGQILAVFVAPRIGKRNKHNIVILELYLEAQINLIISGLFCCRCCFFKKGQKQKEISPK